MIFSKKIIACAVVCAILGAGGTAYASRSIPEITRFDLATVNESAGETYDGDQTGDGSALSNDVSPTTKSAVESTFTTNKETPEVEVQSINSRWNLPSEGDEIFDDYFVHTYSDGTKAHIPFDSEIERNYSNIPTRPIDVNALKVLGSNEPLTSEISYEVVEFLDGTKRYFKLGEALLAFTDPLRYGIYTYIEGGSGEYYSEVLPNGMTVCGWR